MDARCPPKFDHRVAHICLKLVIVLLEDLRTAHSHQRETLTSTAKAYLSKQGRLCSIRSTVELKSKLEGSRPVWGFQV